MPDTSTSNPFAALFGKKGDAYSSEDMTDDAIAVMDALGWERAHIFGHSLGGALAQRIAIRHPDRVLSVVSSAGIPSDASGLWVACYLQFGLLAKLARMKFPEGRESDIAASLAVTRGVASPDYPFDDTAAHDWIERQVDSGPRDTKAQPPDRCPVARAQALRPGQAHACSPRRQGPDREGLSRQGYRQARPRG